ncbi:EF-P lysine aminoacylase EpmA [Motiliproteus sp. MSK22-1]|uniref:EF-P lysine aminoacylase EpmA n=1 Tax=Motiliproteus sp. MSK22-1 TaxID=1897630 RepID=UPI00097830D4|nr:EF-P lysine aminoacylase EpmA [Motiliproteus sp. MSK22-1]OMH38104.1 EF-P lysine aminoacylase GenX [Motiliproteus sp. MSK22-1]
MTDWQPSASLKLIRKRAKLYRLIREFFAQRKVMEVDTPVLSAAAVSDPYLYPMRTEYQGPGTVNETPLYLQTSPEYPMKRLLAAGSGAIYQLAKAFRNGESGAMHNPEFCMLEWYRPGFNDHKLMDEVAALVQLTIGCGRSEKLSYRELFQRYLDIDPHQATVAELKSVAEERLELSTTMDDRDGWLNLLISHLIEPKLRQPTFIYDYPASQAALARVETDSEGVAIARRFELYVGGVELANGYFELVDSTEQACRFEADQRHRQQLGIESLPTDHRLVEALEAGLPSCAGVALGVDRLLMLATGATHINEVMAFPLDRA